MLRTTLAALSLALLAYFVSAWLTHDHQVWTAEGARRLEVALHPVPAPEVSVSGPGFETQALPQLLAAGAPVTLVDFVYTRCQAVCLALGSGFQQLQAAIKADAGRTGSPSRLKLLSISFDAEYDREEVLARYAAGLKADPQIWRFARVARTQELQRLLDRFEVVVIPDGIGGYEHNAALLVIDVQGRLVRIFDYAELDLALAFARDLAEAGSPG